MPEEVTYPDDFAAFQAMREGKAPEAEPEKPAQESAAPPVEESTDDAAKAAPESAPEEEQDEEQPDKPKGKGGFQRRIDKLTAKVHELERQLADKPAAQSQQEEPQAPTTEPAAPKLSDFGTIEEYEAANVKYFKSLVKWEREQERKAEEQKAAKQRQQKEAETFAERVKAAEVKYPDFQEVAFSQDVPYSPAMVKAVSELAEGADVAYHLGKHPEDAARIAKLSDTAAIVEIGKIVAKLSAPATPKPAATKAPKPPAVVQGAAPVAQDVYDAKFGSDYAAWERARVQQLKSRP